MKSNITLSSGQEMIHYQYDMISSTQTLAKEQISNLSINKWHLYTAKGQSNGIGQHDKSWHSPYGLNIYATYCFFLKENNKSIMINLPQITALSVSEVLEQYEITSTIKWVNDVLIKQKKVCGILVNCASEQKENYTSVLIGIGINVNSGTEHLNNIQQPATSMKIATSKTYDITEVIHKLSNILEKNVNSLIANSFKIFKNPIEDKLEKFDKLPVIFEESKDQHSVGYIKSVGDYGQLIFIERKTGEEKNFFNGRILRGKEIAQGFTREEILSELINEIHFETINSTQTYAKENLDLAKNGWQVITADYQTNGIGRSGPWLSTEKQSILATFMFPYFNQLTKLQLSQIAALSVLDTFREYGVNQETKIKWKNDVLMNNKKISGVLVDILDNDSKQVCLIGIGININQDSKILDQINQPATSLKASTNSDNIPIKQLFKLLEKNLYLNVNIANQYGYEHSKDNIQSNLAYLNKKIRVHDVDKNIDVTGILSGLSDNGGIIIDSTYEVLNGKIDINYSDNLDF